MYTCQKKVIKKINKIIEQSQRGTGVWVEIEGWKKAKLVNKNNIYKTEEEAKNAMRRRDKMKKQKEERLAKEMKEIDNVIDKIYQDFGIEIRFLSRPWTIEEADELYSKLLHMKTNNKEGFDEIVAIGRI